MITQPTPAAQPLRLGILGAAGIARGFVLALVGSNKVIATAIASRELDKATQFANTHGIPRVLPSYAALLADPDIDAIYNPLPNGLHAEWSIRALEAGKHVLCEKPLAVNADEVRAMFAAAARCGKHLFEAFPYRAQAQTLKLLELVRAGAIGRLQHIQAHFGFTLKDPANVRWIPALGGGALLDAGSYPVSLVRMLAGERPNRVTASAQWHTSGVDTSVSATLSFPSGLVAQIVCSFNTALHRAAVIVGDNGVIDTSYANHTSVDNPAILLLRTGTGWAPERKVLELPTANGFLAEAEAFADCIRLGVEHWNGASVAESIDNAMTLDAILESARCGLPVEITPAE